MDNGSENARQTKPGIVLIVGMLLLFPVQRWIDGAAASDVKTDETLYLNSGKTIRKMSLGLEGLAAHIYWIRTLQYFGRKLIDSDKPINAMNTASIDMPLLAPLLNIIVELDPHHIPAYRFGAIFLPERDIPAAVALLEKGIRENASEWRLYQDIAYIYWQRGNAAPPGERSAFYTRAAEWYEEGGKIARAPWWIRDLSGVMRIKGGSREVARAIYTSYLTSDEKNISAQAVERLKQLRSLDELDLINAVLAKWREVKLSCPGSLRVIAPTLESLGLKLDQEGVPLDPDGFQYEFDATSCQARLAPGSTIAR